MQKFLSSVINISQTYTVPWYICFWTCRTNAFIIQCCRSHSSQRSKHLNNENKLYTRRYQKMGFWSGAAGPVSVIWSELAPVDLLSVQIYTVLRLFLVVYLIPGMPWIFRLSCLLFWMMSSDLRTSIRKLGRFCSQHMPVGALVKCQKICRFSYGRMRGLGLGLLSRFPIFHHFRDFFVFVFVFAFFALFCFITTLFIYLISRLYLTGVVTD